MMNHKDYDTIASAFLGLPLSTKITVYRRLVPVLIVDNDRFQPVRFGVAMNIPRIMCIEALTKQIKEEVVENASEAHNEEVGSEATRQEGGRSEDEEECREFVYE